MSDQVVGTPRPPAKTIAVDHAEEGPSGWAFWAGAIVGGAMIAFGVAGVLRNEGATVPRNLALWLFGSGIVHDAVVLPVAVLAGWATGRVLPRYAWTPVRLGLAWSALVSIVFWPAVRGWGVREANPSLFPLDYVRNLVATLVVTWLLVGMAILVNRRRITPTVEAVR